MIERTEELGLSGRLPIQAGGSVYPLRVLNLEESEVWQDHLAQSIAEMDMPQSADPATLFAGIARQPTEVMLRLVMAYDLDHVLPQPLKRLFTAAELYAAVKQMVRAELPFLEDARSVVEAFGPQFRVVAASVLTSLSQQANSMSGRLPSGDSTPLPSASDSPKSDSSSSGGTVNNGASGKPTRRPSKPRSQPPTAMPT